MGRLQNKVAVVTGGASGMGRATVLRFLEEGAKVVIADFNAATGEDTVAEAARGGYADAVRFIRTDVAQRSRHRSDDPARARCVRQRRHRVQQRRGRRRDRSADRDTVDAWDYTFDVLAKGVFLGIKHAARAMREQGRGGSIINTASIAGLSGDGGPLVYSAAKAAVISLSQSAAVELAGDRIRVNSICPGFIVTPLAQGANRDATQAAFAKSQPWPDYGRGEHIAGAALFLASSDSEFVTGEALIVDGGLTAAGPDLSKKFPRTSARTAKVTGVTKGSTGEAPELRRL